VTRSAAAVLLFTSLIAAIACSDRATKLPVYGVVPPFELTDSFDRPFDSSQLTGKVWIADFIYTHCPGPCPRMTSQMHSVQQKLKNDPDTRLVSFSVDPDRDTPAVLNAFAQKFGGPADDWFFLTGSRDTLSHLARKVFMVGDLIGVMDHSTKFILVDQKRQIRGFYSTFDAEGIPTLLRDVDALRRSRG
jgi:protein SCO1/2